jgi:hypothetical protein
MNRYLSPAAAVGVGLVSSSIVRLVVPSRIGLTVTSSGATHYVGLNVVSFWCVIACAVAVGFYLYLRPGMTR